MKNERQIRDVKGKAVETAKDMLEGRVGIIEGSRLMQKLLWQTEITEDDPDLLSFMAIDSETDDLPVGEERRHWSTQALRERDVEIRRCEALYRQTAIEACRRIIERWKRESLTN